MTAMLPAHLSQTLDNLGDAARALSEETRADREERRAERQAQRRRDRLTLTLIGLVAVLVVALGAIAWNNRQTYKRIEDCTTTGGKCNEESQKRVGGAISQLVGAQVVIEACGRVPDNDTVAEIEACVAQRMAKPPR